MERERELLLFSLSIFLFAVLTQNSTAATRRSTSPVPVPFGLVLDFGTLVGKMTNTSIYLAIDDFYAAHPNYTTRLLFHERDSDADVVNAASEALDLLKNVQVQAIVGPLTSSQAEFVLDLGHKSHVPIVSFSATSPSLTPAYFPYFIRAAMNDSSQVSAIAAILGLFGWRQVVPIYEDTVYGTGIIPYLVDAFHGISARIPYRSVIQTTATRDQIKTELYKLKSMSTRVFVVHMSPALASLFFPLVSQVGMMEEGYVWLITDGLTNLLGSLDPSVIESMQGVLGVQPYVRSSRRLRDFTQRWRVKFRQNHPEVGAADPSVYSLWAYDAIWALAMAAERVKTNPGLSSSQVIQRKNNLTDLETIPVSKTGPNLLWAIKETRFIGLSGDFHLVDQQLQSPAFKIINVYGRGWKDVAVWTPSHGITRKRPQNDSGSDMPQRRQSPTVVGPIIWPGESREVLKGWELELPTGDEKKLRVGVPVKDGFDEFVKMEIDPITNRTTFSGYCIEVFDAVMKTLPYSVSYVYVPYENKTTGKSAGNYDQLVHEVALQNFDAVVGDTTILSNRSTVVDFTMPFTESGWTMLVRLKDKPVKNEWVFVQPWSSVLWGVTFVFFFFTGVVVWIMEHRVNPAFRGPPTQQFGLIFYFAFSTMVFSHKEGLVSNFSRIVVIVWVFVVLILQSSFTANLASHLTVRQLEPSVTDIQQLLKNGDKVGYQDGSFLYSHLRSLGFAADNIYKYENQDQYAEALLNGTRNGGVSAIFDEIPYIKVFLKKYCDDYAMAGPISKTGGFGFVFPKGSSLAPDISRAILSLTEGEEMRRIEKKWLGELNSCPNRENRVSSGQHLSLKSFKGLFFITGGVSFLAFLLFLVTFCYDNRNEFRTTTSESATKWQTTVARLVSLARSYDKKDDHSFGNSSTFREENEQRRSSTIHPDLVSASHSERGTPSHSDREDYGHREVEDMEMDEPQAHEPSSSTMV